MVADVERLSAHLDDDAGHTAYADALDRAVAHDAWDADRRADEAAERLGLGRLAPDRRVGTLSGGQRTRLALATLMTTRPACLLLDEPTNHLDDDAIGVLTGFLRDLPGVVLLASHDRVLLDDVCTDLFDLDPAALGTDGDGRAAVRRRLDGVRGASRGGPAPLGGDLRGAAGGAGPAARRDADRRLGDRPQPAAARQRQVHLRLQGRERAAHPGAPQARRAPSARAGRAHPGAQAATAAAAARRPHRSRPAGAGWSSSATSRSPAGSGCRASTSRRGSTCSSRAPTAPGSRRCSACSPAGSSRPPARSTVSARRVAELAQDVRFADPRRGARSTYDALVGAERAASGPRSGRWACSRPVSSPRRSALLSVGQRRRLGLAVAIATEPDLLLLDEPTNHISLTLAGELEEAMATTPGTVVVATHDRWLRRRWDGAGPGWPPPRGAELLGQPRQRSRVRPSQAGEGRRPRRRPPGSSRP